MNSPTASKRSRRFLFAVAVLLVPLLVLFTELAVRLFVPPLNPLVVFASPSHLEAENVEALVEFDADLLWRWKPGLQGATWHGTPLATNAARLPMDRELGAKNGVRVLWLGEMPPADSRLLEKNVRARFPGREIDVIPLACPGYTSAQGLVWLRRDFASLQPDIVIAGFGATDARTAPLPDAALLSQGSQSTVRRWIARSQLLLYVAHRAQQKSAPATPPAPVPRVSETDYVANLAALAELCRAQGAAWAVLPPAETPESYRAALLKEAGARQWPVLDIGGLDPFLFNSLDALGAQRRGAP